MIHVRFRPVDGFPGYFVSDHAHLWRNVGGKIRALKAWRSGNAHYYWTLRRGKVVRKLPAHQIVARAFAEPPRLEYEGQYVVVNHIDGNPANNHLANLEWAIGGANVRHALQLGLWRGRRKMTERR